MDLGQQFLVLRFGTNIQPNCIEEHQKVIDRVGECWFGKIGVVPSNKAIKAVMAVEKPKLILYTKSHAYECDFTEVVLERPFMNYPDYYEVELFSKGIEPKSYYKLTTIKEVELQELNKYVVVSSRNKLTETLYKSMSSYFFAEYPDKDQMAPPVSRHKEKKSKYDKKLLPSNDCRYRKDGRCTLRSCINYKYKCERANMCIKQKR